MPTTLETEHLLELTARKALAQRDFGDFCSLFDPSYDATLLHTRAIVEHLEALERGDIDRLIIEMPPQHGKSYHFSERFPAWFLGRHPEQWVGIGSYRMDRAEGAAGVSLDLFRSHLWPFTIASGWSRDVALGRKKAAGEWSTNYGAEVHAAGIGGSLTGFGANLLAIDDPVKGPEQADSIVYRDKAWNWYRDVARTRARRPFRQLLGATRWHEDDLIGRIRASKAAKYWTVLSLPAIAEENDPLGRPIGEILWPGGPVLPDPAIGEISWRSWYALYQQRPTAQAGSIFERAWFLRRYPQPPRELRDLCDEGDVIAALDAAWKEGVGHSYSAIALWARFEHEYLVLDLWRDRVQSPALKARVRDYFEQWEPTAFLVEDAAAGIGVIQEIGAEGRVPIIAVPAKGSKIARAEGVAPIFQAGKVRLPAHEPWVGPFVEEHVAFPTGTNDDQVDTSSIALSWLRQRRGINLRGVDSGPAAPKVLTSGSNSKTRRFPAWARPT